MEAWSSVSGSFNLAFFAGERMMMMKEEEEEDEVGSAITNLQSITR
jgi:hypothetical protein